MGSFYCGVCRTEYNNHGQAEICTLIGKNLKPHLSCLPAFPVCLFLQGKFVPAVVKDFKEERSCALSTFSFFNLETRDLDICLMSDLILVNSWEEATGAGWRLDRIVFHTMETRYQDYYRNCIAISIEVKIDELLIGKEFLESTDEVNFLENFIEKNMFREES